MEVSESDKRASLADASAEKRFVVQVIGWYVGS